MKLSYEISRCFCVCFESGNPLLEVIPLKKEKLSKKWLFEIRANVILLLHVIFDNAFVD